MRSNINNSKKACILSYGCPENRIDTARMQEFFKQNGWILISNFMEADIIIFNTCGLTRDTQEASIKMINRLSTQKKESCQLIISGCLPKINKERLEEVYQGIYFGSDELERLNEIIDSDVKAQEIHANFLASECHLNKNIGSYFKKITEIDIYKVIIKFLTYTWLHRIDKATSICNPYTYYIKVSTGCLNKCSYCAVRISRGRVRSKTIVDVVEEFEKGVEKGFHEFALLGTDLGAYGVDQGTNLVSLLYELFKKKEKYKIKLRNIHPRFLIQMMPELRQFFQTGKISFLSSAVESGNNRILSLMNRGYKIEDFKEAIARLNKEFPEIQIRTQLMVGFPSETEEEFQDTMQLLDEVTFDFAEVYMFEPRPRTKAAMMINQIPRKVAIKRFNKIFIKSLFNNMERKKKALKRFQSLIKRENKNLSFLNAGRISMD